MSAFKSDFRCASKVRQLHVKFYEFICYLCSFCGHGFQEQLNFDLLILSYAFSYVTFQICFIEPE